MFRSALAGLAVVLVVGASLFPDDAFARRGGGGGFRGGGAGFHGGGMRAAGFGGSAMHAGRIHGGRHGMAGRPRPVHPIAGRPGRPGHPIAGRPGRPIAGYPGGYYPRRGWAGAAAVGAAAAGAYGYYNNYNSGCYTDSYGNSICPQQYPYQY